MSRFTAIAVASAVALMTSATVAAAAAPPPSIDPPVPTPTVVVPPPTTTTVPPPIPTIVTPPPTTTAPPTTTTAPPPVVDLPSADDICDKAEVSEVNTLLKGITKSELVGDLSPLVGLTIEEAGSAVVKVDVEIAEVQVALGCDPAPPLTPDAFFKLTCKDMASKEEAQKLLDNGSGNPALLDLNGNGIACDEQVTVYPKGGVDTGGWPQ